MSNTRTNLGFGSELDAFDPSSWSDPPAKTRPAPPEKAATRKVAEAIGFQSREASKQGRLRAASQRPQPSPDQIGAGAPAVTPSSISRCDPRRSKPFVGSLTFRGGGSGRPWSGPSFC